MRFGDDHCEIPTPGYRPGSFAEIMTVHHYMLLSEFTQVIEKSATAISKSINNSKSNQTNMDENVIVLDKDRPIPAENRNRTAK